MPHGTLLTQFVRRPFAGWVNQFHFPKGKAFIYCMTGAGLFICYAARPNLTVPTEERYKESRFYRLNMRDMLENPIYALPPLADGTHGEVIGVQKATGGGHDIHVEGTH